MDPESNEKGILSNATTPIVMTSQETLSTSINSNQASKILDSSDDIEKANNIDSNLTSLEEKDGDNNKSKESLKSLESLESLEGETLAETSSDRNSSTLVEPSDSSGHFSSKNSDISTNESQPQECRLGNSNSPSNYIYLKADENASNSNHLSMEDNHEKAISRILQAILALFFLIFASSFTITNVIRAINKENQENISYIFIRNSQSPSIYPTIQPTDRISDKPSSFPSIVPSSKTESNVTEMEKHQNFPAQSSPETVNSWNIIGNNLYGGSYQTHYGYSIVISNDGKTLAVCEFGENTKQISIFDYASPINEWMLLDIIEGPLASMFGSSISISDDGSLIAIGGANYKDRGIVRIYGRNRQSQWHQIGRDIWGKNYDTNFGGSVSLSGNGDIVAIGSSWGDFVQVYRWDGYSWNKSGRELYGDVSSTFGSSVAINSFGNIVAIGAPRGGYVEVFELRNSVWSQRGSKIKGSLHGAYTNFGEVVAISQNGNILVVCTPGDSKDTKGSVHAFEWNGKSYTLKGGEIRGASESYRVGDSVSISRDGSYISYDIYEDNGNGAGVHTFRLNESSWNQISNNIRGGKSYIRVALSGKGDTLAVSSASTLTSGNATRQVTVYKRSLL